METPPILATPRLRLRPWHDDDRPAFARMNADPRVMACFLSLLSREESDALLERIRERWRQDNLGWWAVEVPGDAPFIGFVGLLVPSFQAHFTPCVEIGWRLAAEHWGRGYATEAARAALAFGFEQRGLHEIVSFTVPANTRSIRVMERLGMQRNPADDFDRESIPEGHRLRRHVLYRLTRSRWAEAPPP
jgi:ribosomal-protein-alanine N-acetyltransferase